MCSGFDSWRIQIGGRNGTTRTTRPHAAVSSQSPEEPRDPADESAAKYPPDLKPEETSSVLGVASLSRAPRDLALANARDRLGQRRGLTEEPARQERNNS